MYNSKTKLIACLGVMSALMFIVSYLETYVFVVLIPLAPPAILSLSLACALSMFSDWKNMFIGGTIFGCCSLFVAAAIGNPVFILPWISVLPRIFVGMSAFGGKKLANIFCSKSTNKFLTNYLPYSIGAVFGVITNTVLVLSVMYLCGKVGIEDVLATFMAINFPLEVVGSAIISPILCNVMQKLKFLK